MTASQARARAIELLGEVGIPAPERRIDQYPHHFSGGMRQRVVIALALCANPKLIIADEPTTALDVSIQAQIIALLKRLCQEHGTAVMLVTHDMGVIGDRKPRGGDVCRPHRRDRAGASGGEACQASLYPRPYGLDPHDGPGDRPPGPDRGLHAAPDLHPGGLRLQPPLPQGLRTAARPTGRSRSWSTTRGWPACSTRRRRLMSEAAEAAQRFRGHARPAGHRAQAKYFDVSAPLLTRVLERLPKQILKAVDGIDFEIQPGETFSLVGRVRLRQVHRGPPDRRAARTDRRQHRVRGPVHQGSGRARRWRRYASGSR